MNSFSRKTFLAFVGLVLASMNSLASSASPMTEELRDHVLAAKASDFGIDAKSLPNGAWGIIMDTQYPEGPATVVALADGSASLYLGARSGVIGGAVRERVRAASKAAVVEAIKHFQVLHSTTNFSLPKIGQTQFLILTSRGAYASTPVAEQTLGNNQHELSPIFYAIQDVITALRFESEGTK